MRTLNSPAERDPVDERDGPGQYVEGVPLQPAQDGIFTNVATYFRSPLRCCTLQPSTKHLGKEIGIILNKRQRKNASQPPIFSGPKKKQILDQTKFDRNSLHVRVFFRSHKIDLTLLLRTAVIIGQIDVKKYFHFVSRTVLCLFDISAHLIEPAHQF